MTERSTEQRRIWGWDGVGTTADLGPEPRCWIEQDSEGNEEKFFAVVPLRNVGPGTAIFSSDLNDIQFLPSHPGWVNGPLRGRPSTPVVASGDVIDLVFFAWQANDALGNLAEAGSRAGRDATFEVRYLDFGRMNQFTTRLRLSVYGKPLLYVETAEVEGPTEIDNEQIHQLEDDAAGTEARQGFWGQIVRDAFWS